MYRRSWWWKSSRLMGLMMIALALIITLGNPGLALAQKGGDATPIAYGDSVQGTITDTQYQVVYSFEGQAGDVVTIDMVHAPTGNLDPYLILSDTLPVGPNPLAFNDDVSGSFDSQIADFSLPAAGTYYIIATRFGAENGTSTGDFTLTLTSSAASAAPAATEETVSGGAFGGLPIGNLGGGGEAGAAPTEQAVAQPTPIGDMYDGYPVITYGETVQQTITDSDWAWGYAFQGMAGDEVTITLESAPGTNLDPYVGLLDAEQNVLAEDDDSAGGLNSQIAFTLPETGVYIIIATRYGLDEGTSSGPFILTLEGVSGGGSGSGGGSAPAAGEADLTYGDTVQGMIDNTDWFQPYTFNGQAGDTVTITLLAAPGSTLDPYLGLLDSQANVVAEDDDSAGGLNSQIVVTLTADDLYTIVATRYGLDEGTSSGEFILSLSAGESAAPAAATPGSGAGGLAVGASLAYGDSVQGMIDNTNWFQSYTFNGQAGDTVTITLLAAPGSTLDPYLGLLDSGQNVLMEDDDSAGGLNSQITFTLPASGTYTIIATRYGFDQGTSSGAFVLSLN